MKKLISLFICFYFLTYPLYAKEPCGKPDDIRVLIEYVAEETQAGLPENMGLGIEMTECKLKGDLFYYTVVWHGMKAEYLDDELIVEMKQDVIDEVGKVALVDPATKVLLVLLRDYGYEFQYVYHDEEGRVLFRVTLPLDDLLSEKYSANKKYGRSESRKEY